MLYSSPREASEVGAWLNSSAVLTDAPQRALRLFESTGTSDKCSVVECGRIFLDWLEFDRNLQKVHVREFVTFPLGIYEQ